MHITENMKTTMLGNQNSSSKAAETLSETHLGSVKCESQAFLETQNVSGFILARPRCDPFGVFHCFRWLSNPGGGGGGGELIIYELYSPETFVRE